MLMTGMRTQLCAGPLDGQEFELPDGAITDPGASIALPVSSANDPGGLQYAVYRFGASPERAGFMKYGRLYSRRPIVRQVCDQRFGVAW
jgi:hypothetical protein